MALFKRKSKDNEEGENYSLKVTIPIPPEWAHLPDEEIQRRVLENREMITQRVNATLFSAGADVDGKRTEMVGSAVTEGKIGNAWDRFRGRTIKTKWRKVKKT